MLRDSGTEISERSESLAPKIPPGRPDSATERSSSRKAPELCPAALSPRTLPTPPGFLPRFRGCSSPVCSCSAGEQKTNGLICAKSGLQLHHLLLSAFLAEFPSAPDKNECKALIKVLLCIVRGGHGALPHYLHF